MLIGNWTKNYFRGFIKVKRAQVTYKSIKTKAIYESNKWDIFNIIGIAAKKPNIYYFWQTNCQKWNAQ